jgi:preprotein translocase SecE subunit
MGFGQYLKDTRAELRHVAWPTQAQTVIFTILVAAVSVGIAVYLGLFDYVFTSGLARILGVSASVPTEVASSDVVTSVTPGLDIQFGSTTEQ